MTQEHFSEAQLGKQHILRSGPTYWVPLPINILKMVYSPFVVARLLQQWSPESSGEKLPNFVWNEKRGIGMAKDAAEFRTLVAKESSIKTIEGLRKRFPMYLGPEAAHLALADQESFIERLDAILDRIAPLIALAKIQNYNIDGSDGKLSVAQFIKDHYESTIDSRPLYRLRSYATNDTNTDNATLVLQSEPTTSRTSLEENASSKDTNAWKNIINQYKAQKLDNFFKLSMLKLANFNGELLE